MDRIPFPEFLRKFLRSITQRAARIHTLAPLGAALAFSYVSAGVTLWLLRQPLYFLWPIFGWVSGHDVSWLYYYNIFAHILAFVVALKVVIEMQPLGGPFE